MVAEPDKPVRILLFSALFPHNGEPTLGIFVENRLRHLLADQPVQATVVAPVPWFPFKHAIFGSYARSAAAQPVEEKDGYTVYHPRYLVIPKIGMLLTPFTLAYAGRRCIAKLKRQGVTFDLIDSHYLYPDAVAASRLAAHFKVPWVATARGSDVSQIGAMPKPRRMMLKALETASHIIAVSRSLKQRMVGYGIDAQRISSLRNGVDTARFKPDPAAGAAVCAEVGLDPSRPVVMFGGLLIPRKRVDIVIDAVSQIEGAQALIVGDGPLAPALKDQVGRLGLKGRVAFTGRRTPAEMPRYFAAADVLCLPSEREGWANVLLEALACGTPVVAHAVDGACDLVTEPHAGRLVDGATPADYAAAIKDVLQARYDRDTVRSFAARFGWEAVSAAQMDVFEAAIAGRPIEARDLGAAPGEDD